MNEKALRTLEYDKIIERLKQQAGSETGRQLCAALLPKTDLEEITQMQRETTDALNVCFRREVCLLTVYRIFVVQLSC